MFLEDFWSTLRVSPDFDSVSDKLISTLARACCSSVIRAPKDRCIGSIPVLPAQDSSLRILALVVVIAILQSQYFIGT